MSMNVLSTQSRKGAETQSGKACVPLRPAIVRSRIARKLWDRKNLSRYWLSQGLKVLLALTCLNFQLSTFNFQLS